MKSFNVSAIVQSIGTIEAVVLILLTIFFVGFLIREAIIDELYR